MTNTGTEKPSTAKTMMTRSVIVPAFQAAITPIGTATRMAKMMVAMASASVGSSRWPISLATGRLEKMEVPRSPESSAPTQLKNWMWSGSFRPRFSRIFSMSSGRA